MNRSTLALALLVAPLPTCPEGDARLHGTAVLVEADGGVRAGLDGAFVLEVQDAPALARRVEVRGGRWSVDAPAARFVRPVELELDGHAALGFAPWVALEHAGGLEVRGERVRAPSVLRVVAAEDGRALDGVEVLYGGLGSEHPGIVDASERALDAAESPVTLPLGFFDRRMRTDYVWVRAPERAWRRVTIDLLHGGEQRVELVRGGALELDFAEPAPEGARLLLLPAERDWLPACGAALDPRGVRLDGLEPGRYVARVVVGPFPSCPRLGEARVLVEAGATARATLALEPAVPPPPGGRVTIRVAIGPSWDGVAPKLELAPESEDLARWVACVALRDTREVLAPAAFPRAEDGERLVAWDAPYDGRYVAYLWPMDAYGVLEVEGGAGELRLEAPPATRVTLRLVEAGSGERLGIERALWHAVVPDAPPGADGRSHRVEPAPGEDALTFLARSGRVVLRARSVDGREHEELLELAPGERTLEWRLAPR